MLNIGDKYGKLTILEITNKRLNRCIIYKCKCDCGNIVETTGTRLTHGYIQSCGCLQKDFAKSTAINEIGNKHGFLSVISRAETPKGEKTAYWNCLCDCGNSTIVEGTKLRSGHTSSCGKCNCFSSSTKRPLIRMPCVPFPSG